MVQRLRPGRVSGLFASERSVIEECQRGPGCSAACSRACRVLRAPASRLVLPAAGCWLLAVAWPVDPFAAHVPALLQANSSISSSSFFPCRTKIKIRLETAYGEWVERIPAWIKWATQVSVGTGVENCAVCMCCLGLTI